MTARHSTTLGSLASPRKSLVDSRGLVGAWGYGWSLDWWVGADDRWHFPSLDDGIRQRLVSLTPVVETAMRVPGGDAVQRVYAVAGAGGSDELLVIEVENRSPVPFAVAWAVQGLLSGDRGVASLDLVERTVALDGRPALYLPRRPSRCAVSQSGGASLASLVESGAAVEHFESAPPPGPCGAAFIYPLAHTATMRVAIPLLAAPAGGRRRAQRRRWPPPPDTLPAGADAARAWQAQTRRGCQVELPPGRLSEAIEANRRFLLVFHPGEAVGGSPTVESAMLLVALDRWGFGAEGAEMVRGFVANQQRDGRFGDGAGATGAVLWAIGEHRRLGGDVAFLASGVAAAAGSIQRARHGRRRGGEFSYPAALWSLRGLLDAAALLRAVGEDRSAATVASSAAEWRADLDSSVAGWMSRTGGSGGPATSPAFLLVGACGRLGLYPPTDPAIVAAVDAVRIHLSEGAGVPDPALLTLELAAVELAAGDRRALDRLASVIDSASDTWTWPAGADGHDLATTAEFCSLVRNLLVRDVPGGVALCSLLPEEWRGQGIEVHSAPTAAGLLSFAIRWHGERPALLWELRPRHDGEIRLRAPGLDPGWSTLEPVGDVLLGPVSGPGGADR